MDALMMTEKKEDGTYRWLATQKQTRNQEEEKGPWKETRKPYPSSLDSKQGWGLGQTGLAKMAGRLCSLRISGGFLKILLFSFFKLLKIYDIPPTYFRFLKRHNDSYCFTPGSVTDLSNSESHFHKKSESCPELHDFIVTLLEPKLSIKEHNMYSFA